MDPRNSLQEKILAEKTTGRPSVARLYFLFQNASLCHWKLILDLNDETHFFTLFSAFLFQSLSLSYLSELGHFYCRRYIEVNGRPMNIHVAIQCKIKRINLMFLKTKIHYFIFLENKVEHPVEISQ